MRLSPLKRPFRLTLGDRGEMAAWNFLLEQGFEILEKNYRCRLGEIDVVTRRGGRYGFVEVKTRTSHDRGLPEEAVTSEKQFRLARLAAWYLKEKNISEAPADFHVVAVDWNGGEPRLRLIACAFDVPARGED